MLSARVGASALNIPEMGTVVVGGRCRDNQQAMASRCAEILIGDARNGSGWRWIELNPMVQIRRRPGVAYFKGCVVTVGMDKELSAERTGEHSVDSSSCNPLPWHCTYISCLIQQQINIVM